MTTALPPQRSSRAAWAGAAVALVALGVAAGVVVATGALGGDDSTTSSESSERSSTGDGTTTDGTTTDGTTEQPPPGPRYERYVSTSGGYDVLLPSDSGWSPPEETVINDAIFRATATGPEGRQVIIDYTPGEAATFRPADRCRPTSHPRLPIAERCVFEGGTLAPCQSSTCVDYLLNVSEGGPGYGVVVGGAEDFAETERIAKRVATSLVPRRTGE